MSRAGFGLRNLSPACGYDIGRAISRFPVVFSRRPHPIPSRTRKLSSSEPMVLHGKPCGRVGRCRDYSVKGPPSAGPFFLGSLVALGKFVPFGVHSLVQDANNQDARAIVQVEDDMTALFLAA